MHGHVIVKESVQVPILCSTIYFLQLPDRFVQNKNELSMCKKILSHAWIFVGC